MSQNKNDVLKMLRKAIIYRRNYILLIGEEGYHEY